MSKYKDALTEYKDSKKYIKDHFGPKPNHCRGVKTLSEEDVAYIRANYCKLGMTELANRLEVSTQTIFNCAKGFTWKHLNHKYRPVF